MGGQDIDLKDRVSKGAMVRMAKFSNGVGCALPNSTVSLKLDRGWAKIANVDPLIAQRCNRSWGTMNAMNSKVFMDKFRKRPTHRNADTHSVTPSVALKLLLGTVGCAWRAALPPPPDHAPRVSPDSGTRRLSGG